MHILINQICEEVPLKAKLIPHYKIFDLNLLIALGYQASNLPLVQLMTNHLKLDGPWAVVCPIFWEASHNNAYIARYGNDMGLDALTLKLSYEAYASFLAEDRMDLQYYNPYLWLISLANHQNLTSKAIYDLTNQPLMPVLDRLDSTGFWQKFITESQMFFSSRPTSHALNGVWVWNTTGTVVKGSVPICADEHWIKIAHELSTDVMFYHKDLELKKFKILLCEQQEILSKTHQKELRQGIHTWYWSNMAYESPKPSLLKRIWSKLIHAH